MEYYNQLSIHTGESSITWYNLRKAVWIRLIMSTEKYNEPTMPYRVQVVNIDLGGL